MSRLIDADKLKQDWLFRGDDGKAYRDVIDAQPTVNQWIPCSERLPEKSGKYIVSGKWGSGKVEVGECLYSVNDGYFDASWNFDVLAWMPLPEPYRTEDAK